MQREAGNFTEGEAEHETETESESETRKERPQRVRQLPSRFRELRLDSADVCKGEGPSKVLPYSTRSRSSSHIRLKTAMCMNNHPMDRVAEKMEIETVTCDECHKDIPACLHFFDCRTCNYNVCANCHQAAMRSDFVLMAESKTIEAVMGGLWGEPSCQLMPSVATWFVLPVCMGKVSVRLGDVNYAPQQLSSQPEPRITRRGIAKTHTKQAQRPADKYQVYPRSVRCINSHPMDFVAEKMEHEKVSCDKCHGDILAGFHFFDCRTCDYNICSFCRRSLGKRQLGTSKVSRATHTIDKPLEVSCQLLPSVATWFLLPPQFENGILQLRYALRASSHSKQKSEDFLLRRRMLQQWDEFAPISSLPGSKASLADYVYLIKAREALRVRKAAGAPWPWSEDSILNIFKFTNVKREHDRTTLWMREHLTGPHSPSSDPGLVIFNCSLFRMFGSISMGETLGWQREFDAQAIIQAAVECRAAYGHAFTISYCLPRYQAEGKNEASAMRIYTHICERYLKPLWLMRNHLGEVARKTLSWQNLVTALRGVPGFNGTGFMAKEVCQDVMHTYVMQDCTDRNTFCVIGPGARRGLNRLRGRERNFGVTRATVQDEGRFLQECIDLYSFLLRSENDWCNEVGLDLHDVQFQLCEFDKYQRIRRHETGRRRRYTLPPGAHESPTADSATKALIKELMMRDARAANKQPREESRSRNVVTRVAMVQESERCELKLGKSLAEAIMPSQSVASSYASTVSVEEVKWIDTLNACIITEAEAIPSFAASRREAEDVVWAHLRPSGCALCSNTLGCTQTCRGEAEEPLQELVGKCVEALMESTIAEASEGLRGADIMSSAEGSHHLSVCQAPGPQVLNKFGRCVPAEVLQASADMVCRNHFGVYASTASITGALIDALNASDLAGVHHCVEVLGQDVNGTIHALGVTPLALAVQSQSLAIVRYLVECGAECNPKTINACQRAVLHEALDMALYGQSPQARFIVEVLLAGGADPGTISWPAFGQTAHLSTKQLDLVQDLLELLKQDISGYRPWKRSKLGGSGDS